MIWVHPAFISNQCVETYKLRSREKNNAGAQLWGEENDFDL